MTVLRLSLVAPSGSGKSSTASFMLARARAYGFSARIVKLASPLYDLQRRYYEIAGEPIAAGAQNQPLLEQIARDLRAIRADALVHDFFARLADTDADIVINDDLRDMDVDLPALRARGFRTVRVMARQEVRARRLKHRGDLRTLLNSPLDAPLVAHEPDYVIENNGDDLAAYERTVAGFIDGLLATLPAAAKARTCGRREGRA